jgi:hypothetical protein
MFDKLIDVTVKKDLSNDILQCLKELKNKKVCIGVPQEDNVERNDSSHERITNAQLLYIQTHGIRDNKMINAMQHDIKSGKPYSKAYEMYVHEHGSPLFKTPPRPVLEPAMDNSKDKIAEQLKLAFQAVLNGSNVSDELSKVGMLGQDIARKWFTDPDNKWAANSPLTVKKKGSNKPLIDTGALRASITYAIRDGSK